MTTTQITSPKFEEIKSGINVFETRDERNNPMTVVEKGSGEQLRLSAQFGKDGKWFCTIISDKLAVTLGDALVTQGVGQNISINQGVLSEGSVNLEKQDVKPIKSINVKENGVDEGYYNLEDRYSTKQEIYNALEEMGIVMNRSENGALAHTSPYTFLVTDPSSEVYVNIGDGRYIKSEGFTSLQVNEGSVFIKTSLDNVQYEVIVNIR